MTKTRVLCTVGPVSANDDVLTGMINAGAKAARLNFSHGTYEEQLEKIKLIKKVRSRLGVHFPIMLDTKGPECRIKSFKNHKVNLEEGSDFILTTNDCVGDHTRVSVTYDNLINELNIGDTIFLNNGLIRLKVDSLDDSNAYCKVMAGGILSDKKSLYFPNKELKNDYLSNEDKEDILFGVKNGIEIIAASFVSKKEDVESLKQFLIDNAIENVELIAKIENQQGVDNIDEICDASDGIIIARGDLGDSIPYEKIPYIQKILTKKCIAKGKKVILATEMLQSMITNPRPTRAEVSDVYNAVLDGVTDLLLTGETAEGKYPVEAIENMVSIVKEAEK